MRIIIIIIVGEVSFVELFEDDYGKPRGSGVVEFERVEHARIALEKMNRFDLKGRRLIVKEVRILPFARSLSFYFSNKSLMPYDVIVRLANSYSIFFWIEPGL